MAIEYTQTVSSLGLSDWIRVDSSGKAGHNFFILVDMEEDGGSVVDVEFSIEKNLDSNTKAMQHHILKDVDESLASNLKIPITGIRLNVLTYGSGSVVLRVMQHED
jgi:hypothetical protein